MNGLTNGKEKALMAAATPFFIAVCIGLTTGTWDATLLGMAAAGLFAGLVVYFTPNSVHPDSVHPDSVHPDSVHPDSEGFTSPSGTREAKAKKDDLYRK